MELVRQRSSGTTLYPGGPTAEMGNASVTATGRRVSVLGTGDFGRAFATQAIRSGYHVAMGSRNPDARQNLAEIDPTLSKVHVVSIPECLTFSDVIVLAIPAEAFATLGEVSQLAKGKTVIDVSNSKADAEKTGPGVLMDVLPGACVVKAFSTISAYDLAAMITENRSVFVCGDDITACHVVMQLASQLGLLPVHAGSLARAQWVERRSREVFPNWTRPSLVLAFLLVTWQAYAILRHHVLKKSPYSWDRLPCNVFNKAIACVAITLLASVYLPGCLAAFTQLANGTRRKRFPRALNCWLSMRKQLGLYALLCAVVHLVTSLALLSPAYYPGFYLKRSVTVPVNRTDDIAIDIGSRMNWIGEIVILIGILTLLGMCVLGITSIPSVAERLNRPEWNCLHSGIGYTCLLLSAAHVTFKAAPNWLKANWVGILVSLTFICQLLPWLTLAMKAVLLLPCIYSKLKGIRIGLVDRDGSSRDCKPRETGNQVHEV